MASNEQGSGGSKIGKALKDNIAKAIKQVLKKLIQKKVIITLSIGLLIIVAGYAAFSGIGSILRTIWDGTVNFFKTIGGWLQRFWNWLWTGQPYDQDTLWFKLEQKYNSKR